MKEAPEDIRKRIIRRAEDFAAARIATWSGLSAALDFPVDLWQDMGTAGLLGIAVPEEYGGSGFGYPEISAVGKALARQGLCLGITLSWLMHQITARFFLCRFASDDQKQACLPAMARGAMTASIAISEPGAGGHPKHLKTSAEKTGSGYVLQGEKSFLTNGPIADLFIVLAVSGYDGGRKRYSAFLVPKESRGLRITGPMDVGFLRPCPHGGIILESCVVPEESLLGNHGTAYEDMALPFREVEDTAMMGPILGAQEARFNDIVEVLRQRAGPLPDETAFRLGGISSSMCALAMLARESALHLETSGVSEPLESLVLAFRSLCGQVHHEISDVAAQVDLDPSGACRVLGHDLDQVVRFAGRVSRLKQTRLGTRLATSEGEGWLSVKIPSS